MSRIHWQAPTVENGFLRPALHRAALLGALAISLTSLVVVGAAALAASAASAAPIALDAPDNGGPPLIAFDPSTQTTYVAWADPVKSAVDLCILPAGATACEGGTPVLLEDSHFTGDNFPGPGGLVVLPGGEVAVIGKTGNEGSIAWISPAGGTGFLSKGQGLQNGGEPISPVDLYYVAGNAVALSSTDVALLDDYGDYFGDTSLIAASPAISEPNSNQATPPNPNLFPRKALDTAGPEIAAEPAPPPAAAGTDVVVGVGDNFGGPPEALPGCLNQEGTGYGVSVGKVDGTSNAAGTLNAKGLPGYGVLACSAEAPVLAQGGTDGIGVLEEEGDGIDGAGSQYTLDYRPFDATSTGGAFGAPVELANVTGEVLDGVDSLDMSEDSSTGVYALWEDGKTVLDYSSNGGANWGGAAVTPVPYTAGGVIVGTGGGNADIAYAYNPGTGTQVFLESLNYAALYAADHPPAPFSPPAPPPTPNSGYTIQSIVGNSNGTVTITFVPTQSGEATMVVTVPTASIASASATDAKAKKCKKGQVKIKGKCLPSTTVTGKASASGTAGVPLKLTVYLSSKIKAQLKKGKTVHLTATLTYTSSLGGTPTVKTYSVTVKGKRPHHHK
jgi:hypothetical protein